MRIKIKVITVISNDNEISNTHLKFILKVIKIIDTSSSQIESSTILSHNKKDNSFTIQLNYDQFTISK